VLKPNELGKLVVDLFNVLNLDGFINFNFGSAPARKLPKTLTPANIEFDTKIRLKRIQGKFGLDNEGIIKKLNMPESSKLARCPLSYKYAYAYYIKFKTSVFHPGNHVSDAEITKPVDNAELFAKLLL